MPGFYDMMNRGMGGRAPGGMSTQAGGMGTPAPGPPGGAFTDPSMPGQIMNSMFGGGGPPGAPGAPYQAGGPGVPMFPNRGGDPTNNFGMGQRPGPMSMNVAELQARCRAGEGDACNQLAVAEARFANQQAQWQDEFNRRRQMYNMRPGSMSARSGW